MLALKNHKYIFIPFVRVFMSHFSVPQNSMLHAISLCICRTIIILNFALSAVSTTHRLLVQEHNHHGCCTSNDCTVLNFVRNKKLQTNSYSSICSRTWANYNASNFRLVNSHEFILTLRQKKTAFETFTKVAKTYTCLHKHKCIYRYICICTYTYM